MYTYTYTDLPVLLLGRLRRFPYDGKNYSCRIRSTKSMVLWLGSLRRGLILLVGALRCGVHILLFLDVLMMILVVYFKDVEYIAVM
jgi:hypothetical protein|eukprot:COSAG01_NODE_12790_length_1685_cov_1.619798_1_plen_86_part_00